MDRRIPTGLDEANQLYWSSNKGVNQLAEELGVSKGMLYAAIQPKPSGFRCGDCSDQLVYANRTALERSMLNCPACGSETPEREARLRLWEGKNDPAITSLSVSDAPSPERGLRIDLLRSRTDGGPRESLDPTGATQQADDTDTRSQVGPELLEDELSLDDPDEIGLHPSKDERTPNARALVGAAALCLGLGVWIGRRLR